jgi:hypothetical protein
LPLEIAARDEVRAEELGVMVVPESASDFTGPQHAEFLRGVYAEALDDQVFMHWGAGRVPTKDVRDAHPWLGIGRMKAGTRLDDTGNLLLPLRDSSLRLAGVMAVDGAGKTQYRVDDVGSQETPAPLFHVLGGWLGRDGKAPMVVTDNLETAVKLHRETKATVVYAADDIESVTKSLQKRFPQRPMHLVRHPKLAERLGDGSLPGWRDDPARQAEHGETKLTAQLCARLNSLSRHSPGWDILQFRREEPDEADGRRAIDLVAAPSGHVILISGRAYNEYQILIPIECKRLPTPACRERDEREYLISKFSSTGGVQRFKAGHYGREHDRAAMIAYVQENDIAHWHSQLGSWIDDLAARPVDGWSVGDKLDLIEHDKRRRIGSLASSHSRKAGLQPIRIDHLWIEM